MADIVDAITRSRMMSQIRSKNTNPEIAIRKALFSLGFRYRIHSKSLPGHPDIVLPKYRAVIFVHGCFWHGHSCPAFKWPKSNKAFWKRKIKRNIQVDANSITELRRQGWRVLTIWECAIRGKQAIGIDTVAKLTSRWIHSRKSLQEIRNNP